MSVHVNGADAATADTHTPKSKASRKRKHDEQVGDSSVKKHKKSKQHREPTEPEEQNEVVATAQVLALAPEKSQVVKKKRRRHSDKHAEPQPTEKAASDAGKIEQDDSAGRTSPQAESTTKHKKKKRRRSEEEVVDQNEVHDVEEPILNAVNQDVNAVNQDVNAVNQDDDIELPDAPSPTTSDANLAEGANEVHTPVLPTEHQEAQYAFGFDFLESSDPSCFYSSRTSLCLPIPAVSLQKASSSILAAHLAPLLLTYFPPVEGIVLGFSDPDISARPSNVGADLPLQTPKDDNGISQGAIEVLARAHEEFGACWVWLTATFLVFQPSPGDELHGWTNVTSEGFVGLVSYNYFQISVGKSRIPGSWSWSGATTEHKKKGKKGRLVDGARVSQEQSQGSNDVDGSQDVGDGQLSDAAHFVDEEGAKVPDTLMFTVVETEMVPAHERDKLSLQIDGSLLDAEAEDRLVEEERAKFERSFNRGRSKTPAADVQMSGGMALSREASVASGASRTTPVPKHRMRY